MATARPRRVAYCVGMGEANRYLSAATAELLQRPARGDHIVQLYQEEADLADALARFAASGLALGEGVVMIGSTARWQALTERLRAGGVDTHDAVLRGQLRLFGARVILASCMSHGVPDRLAFNEAIGGILGLVRTRYPVLRVFGELTDILWAEEKREAAKAIERFWGALIETQPFSLLCACPLDSLDGRAYDGALHSLSAQHRPGTLMPMGQMVMFWLCQHMPRTAEKVLARARARIEP